MGSIRTKLETYKQPRTVKSTGSVKLQNFGPKGSGGTKGLDYSKAFWMARALQKDEEGRQTAELNSQLQTMRRGDALTAGGGIMDKIDSYMQDVDNLLAQLGLNEGGGL